MAGELVELEPAMTVIAPEPLASDHPMPRVTLDIAEGDGWNAERRENVARLFDELSDGWHETHTSELRLAPLVDALDRGDVGTGRLIEVGAGTGAGTERIAPRMPVAAAVDLSAGMLARADASLAPLVQADASRLPIGDGMVDIAVMVNMFLFPAEIDRVLSAAGRVVWVNTMADQTPIRLAPRAVVDALPGQWSGVTSRAGAGWWCVARRA
ncbi:MAG: class I SAM-dependent methyltransferase [Acidimicrobiales bacterium]